MKPPLRALALLTLAAVAPAAEATPVCTIASGALLDFGTVVPLASSSDIHSTTAGSLWVNCSSDVSSTPAIYSSSTREMRSGANILPFQLSAVSSGGLELPMASPGTPLAISNDGSNQTITLYGRLRAADFKGLPAGQYSQQIVITLEY